MGECEGSKTTPDCYTEIPDGARWCDPCAIDLQDGEPEMPPMDHPCWGQLQADLDEEFPAEGRKFDKAMADLAKRAKPVVEYFWMDKETFEHLKSKNEAKVSDGPLGGPRYLTSQLGTPIVIDPKLHHQIDAQVDGERVTVWKKP